MNQSITMVAPVVFDGQALKAIKQVGAADETTSNVMDGNLNLWPWKSGKH